jgi:hypothetical protein
MFSPYGSVCCACAQRPGLPRVSLWQARPPRTASSAQRSRRLCSTRAAALVLLAHAEVTKNTIFFSMGPKRWVPAVGLARKQEAAQVQAGVLPVCRRAERLHMLQLVFFLIID